MCLYPKRVANRHYLPNKKNGGWVPECKDERLRGVIAKCGKCIECRQQRAREWQVRLSIEIEAIGNARFMTMTFSPESIRLLYARDEVNDDNSCATTAVKLFIKRWKKRYNEPLHHWLVTELGHEGTERLHLHGFLWTKISCAEIEEVWKYGWVDTGEYVDQSSVAYCVKYVSKVDEKHPEFISKVLASPSIGKSWLKRKDASDRKFAGKKTIQYFRLPNGKKINMPEYFRKKLYNDEEKEYLRLQKEDAHIMYICGERIDISTIEGKREAIKCREYHRIRSNKLGYK